MGLKTRFHSDVFFFLSPGPRSKLHLVTEQCRTVAAQTQPPPQGPAALCQANGVAEEHAEGEI